jgi:elongation factor Ts
MAEFTAKDVAALRKATGAGMMDAKRALEENDGDAEAAKDWLRKKGLAGPSKRSDRTAADGVVEVILDGPIGAVVEVNCESDFVAKGSDFTSFVGNLAEVVAEKGADDVSSLTIDGAPVAEAVAQLGTLVGEKVELGRIARYESTDGIVDGYQHVQNERGTIGVLVELGGVDPSDPKAREVAHDIALHIASAAPRYISRDDVPADIVEKERSVLEELSRNEGKPEQALPKIVEGRLNGFFKEMALLEQPFVREPKTTVRSLLEGLGATVEVRRFERIKIGEGGS